jgi:hypothetical protein
MGTGGILSLLRAADASAEPLCLPPDLPGSARGRTSFRHALARVPHEPPHSRRRLSLAHAARPDGDIFELGHENRLAESTNVHWHGLAAPADAAGMMLNLEIV